ncbi:hypothetical protein HY311_01790 [Candidatus Nomurabacteria bacterium]|nr:hypothetical protein [Candidatus Nomurabacteria bacterium]
MEPNFQTSFIPKKPIVDERAISPRPVGIFLITSLFVLVTVIVATIGLFFYKGIVGKNISDMEKTLTLAKNRFEPAKITELQVLDKRLSASTEILSKHITVTPIFTALADLTMRSVRYTKFSYTVGESSNSMVEVKMSGLAVGYRSIALQSDLFTQNKNIIDPIFSDLTLDNTGNVLFDLDFSVNPNFVNYKQNLLTQAHN